MKIVDWATLDENVRVVRSEPMEIVDRQIAREHVVVLALHSQSAPVNRHHLRRAANDSEISRLFRQHSEMKGLN